MNEFMLTQQKEVLDKAEELEKIGYTNYLEKMQ